ncbi:MAG: hypothetical protein KUG69_04045 [Marinosulfonomonas sp.]|nr:hypothetical protein [Marinosulfonomonas sp.]
MQQELNLQYQEEITKLVDILVDSSLHFLKSTGNFLPHGAAMTPAEKIVVIMSGPDTNSDITNSEEVLPKLYEGLRDMVRKGEAWAVATAENVRVGPEGGKLVDAMKVVYENHAGLNVAVYTPFRKRFFGGYKTLPKFSNPSEPEIILDWQIC